MKLYTLTKTKWTQINPYKGLKRQFRVISLNEQTMNMNQTGYERWTTAILNSVQTNSCLHTDVWHVIIIMDLVVLVPRRSEAKQEFSNKASDYPAARPSDNHKPVLKILIG